MLRKCIDWADRVRPQPEKQHLHQKDGDNLSCEAVCQPSILQEWSTHKEGKEEVESKQVNNLQMTEFSLQTNTALKKLKKAILRVGTILQIS